MTRTISNAPFLLCCLLLYCLLLCSPILLPAQSSENLFDYKHSMEFANYLYQSNQYELAAEEYERVHFLKPTDTTAKVMILKSYRKATAFDAGITTVERWQQGNNNALARPIGVEFSKTLILARKFDLADQYVSRNEKLKQQDKTFLKLNSELLQHDYKEAQQLFSKSFMHLPEQSFSTYNNLIADGLEMKLKSPAWAAIMSGIVPGTGRLYTGDWKDGLISMLMIGSVGYGSYRAFSKRGSKSALGWVYGGLGLGLYLGNIYGTYQSAVDYNTEKQNAFEEQVRDRIDPYF